LLLFGHPNPEAELKSYRCHYHPQDRDGWPLPNESGVLPFLQLKATSAEDAQRKAHHTTGCAVAEVLRIEQPLSGVAMSADLRAWLRGRPTAASALATPAALHPQGPDQRGAHSVGAAEEDHERAVLGPREHVDGLRASGTFGKHLRSRRPKPRMGAVERPPRAHGVAGMTALAALHAADQVTRMSLEAAHEEWKRHRFDDRGAPLVHLIPQPEVSESGFGDFAADSHPRHAERRAMNYEERTYTRVSNKRGEQVLIGHAVPPRPQRVEGSEALRLQAALLGDKRSRFERALDFIDTHPKLTLAAGAATAWLYWLVGA
jgi:hypothetical protein